MQKWNIKKIELPLAVNWKLSRNETKIKYNLIVEFQVNGQKFLGEMAPNIHYGESVEKSLEEFNHFQKLNITTLAAYQASLKAQKFCACTRNAIEWCLVAHDAYLQNKNLYQYFGTKKISPIYTSYTIPIMPIGDIKEYMAKYNQFHFYKIKVNKESALDLVLEVAKYTQKPLRIDGNEAWTSVTEFLAFEQKIKHLNIEFIEQPFFAKDFHLYLECKNKTHFALMADESCTSDADIQKLSEGFHMLNVKLMKTGGPLLAIKQLNEARALGMKTMIGCMIETGLGISQAKYLASLCNYFDLDGNLLLQEDPYKTFDIN